MRRTLVGLLTAALLGLPALAGTAAAEVKTFTDPAYDSSPLQSIDILSGSVELTTAQLRVSVQTATGLSPRDWVTLDIDTTGDAVPEFMYDPFLAILGDGPLTRPVASVAGSPFAPRKESVPCTTTSVTAGHGSPGEVGNANPAVVTIPATCLGSPASVQVTVQTNWFHNSFPGCIGCGTSSSSKDTVVAPPVSASAAPVSVVPTPTPTATPASTMTPSPPPPTLRPPTAPLVRTRDVTIGIRQAAGIYTFSGVVRPAEAGMQVTIARLDSVTKRVTGVASTRTDASGRYVIRSLLPVGFAGFYTLTETKSDIPAGRSRLYGLVVPRR
jgi:hypothetical protein